MRRQGGFTLIEMIVVIAVLAMVAGLVATSRPLRSSRVDLEASQRIVAGALRLARSQAIVQGRNVWVVSGNDGIAIAGGQSWRLPRGIIVSATEVAFGSDGNSTGGTVMVYGGGRQEAVTVDWLTGRVVAFDR